LPLLHRGSLQQLPRIQLPLSHFRLPLSRIPLPLWRFQLQT
jgi:hypothetical protein